MKIKLRILIKMKKKSFKIRIYVYRMLCRSGLILFKREYVVTINKKQT